MPEAKWLHLMVWNMSKVRALGCRRDYNQQLELQSFGMDLLARPDRGGQASKVLFAQCKSKSSEYAEEKSDLHHWNGEASPPTPVNFQT
jgi:hypothetical protein